MSGSQPFCYNTNATILTSANHADQYTLIGKEQNTKHLTKSNENFI